MTVGATLVASLLVTLGAAGHLAARARDVPAPRWVPAGPPPDHRPADPGGPGEPARPGDHPDRAGHIAAHGPRGDRGRWWSRRAVVGGRGLARRGPRGGMRPDRRRRRSLAGLAEPEPLPAGRSAPGLARSPRASSSRGWWPPFPSRWRSAGSGPHRVDHLRRARRAVGHRHADRRAGHPCRPEVIVVVVLAGCWERSSAPSRHDGSPWAGPASGAGLRLAVVRSARHPLAALVRFWLPTLALALVLVPSAMATTSAWTALGAPSAAAATRRHPHHGCPSSWRSGSPASSSSRSCAPGGRRSGPSRR